MQNYPACIELRHITIQSKDLQICQFQTVPGHCSGCSTISPNQTDGCADYMYVVLYFVCVEVLQPSQPNGVMSSSVSLPNHTLLGRLSPISGEPVLCTFFRQKLTTALLESAEGRE